MAALVADKDGGISSVHQSGAERLLHLRVCRSEGVRHGTFTIFLFSYMKAKLENIYEFRMENCACNSQSQRIKSEKST